MGSIQVEVNKLDEMVVDCKVVDREVVHMHSMVSILGNLDIMNDYKVVEMVFVVLVSWDLYRRGILLCLTVHIGWPSKILGRDSHL